MDGGGGMGMFWEVLADQALLEKLGKRAWSLTKAQVALPLRIVWSWKRGDGVLTVGLLLVRPLLVCSP